MAEGPLPFDNSSFLINYRYSTLSILDQLNLVNFGGVPNYQDLAFKVNLTGNNNSSLTLYGLGGKSQIDIQLSDEDDENEIIQKSDEHSRLGVIGLKYLKSLTGNSYINSTLSANFNGSRHILFKKDTFPELVKFEESDLDNISLHFNQTYHLKINPKHSLESGIDYTKYFLDFSSEYYDQQSGIYKSELNFTGNSSLLQFFTGWRWSLSNNWTLVNGLHFQKSGQNREITVEPRISFSLNIDNKHIINGGIGLHSQMTSLSNYFVVLHDSHGNAYTPNLEMEMLKALHFVLGYENHFSESLMFKAETYYQRLYDIPIAAGENAYSVINQTFGLPQFELVNEGKGRNVGVEFTLEKFFSDHQYYLVTVSLFDSKYLAGDGIWRNTRFNGNYVLNGLYGHEFHFNQSNKHVLSLNINVRLSGGRRLQEIDLTASIREGHTVYLDRNAFAEKGDDIFSLNFSIGHRINSPRVSHEIKLDIQNLTNNRAVIAYVYNDRDMEIVEVNQISIFPVFSYILYF